MSTRAGSYVNRSLIRKGLDLVRDSLSMAAVQAHKFAFKEPDVEPLRMIDIAPEKRVAAESLITRSLQASEPFMAARFGSTELAIMLLQSHLANGNSLSRFLKYLAMGDPYFHAIRARRRMEFLGLAPLDADALSRYHDLMLSSIEKVDLLGSWVPGENFFREHLSSAVFCQRSDLEPFRHASPWSAALAGKRVLVVHPFRASIESQYQEKRSLLFENPAVLPEFELLTYVPVQAHFGEIEGASHWFQALDKMCHELSQIDFEVAIIGAGPFGLPLASHVKSLGRQAIHLGGATQLLFGISGARWRKGSDSLDYVNQHWVSPLPSETPPRGARKMSGNSYW